MSDEVNISFVLDMQRKLYRWSSEDPDKVFVDLFNLVCNRRTLDEAWRRLARNSGSPTLGTDGMTRLTVEQRPGGVATFLEEIRGRCAMELIARSLSGNGSSPNPASRGSSGNSAFPR